MREIVMNTEDFRHIAEAVVNYRKGRDRIEAAIPIVADHMKAGRYHVVDSLAAGEHAKWDAEDALLRELVVQVLVAVQIVMEQKSHIKYKMREDASCAAKNRSDEIFESRKDDLIQEEENEWFAFNNWRQQQAQGNTEIKVKKSKGGHK